MKRVSLGVLGVVVGLLATGAGCAMQQVNPELAKKGVMPDSQTCSVEFRGANGKIAGTRQVEIDVDSHMQDVLNKSGAFKKYARLSAELVRTTPKGNPHVMAVTVDSPKRKVESQCDYHVRAGDRVIITEDPTTVVDDVMNNFGLPARKKPARSTVSG